MLEFEYQLRQDAVLCGVVAEATVLVVRVERLVSEGRRDVVGPVIADRGRTLERDIRRDSEAADIRHHIDEPLVVDVVMQRRADNGVDPVLGAATVDGREQGRSIDRSTS